MFANVALDLRRDEITNRLPTTNAFAHRSRRDIDSRDREEEQASAAAMSITQRGRIITKGLPSGNGQMLDRANDRARRAGRDDDARELEEVRGFLPRLHLAERVDADAEVERGVRLDHRKPIAAVGETALGLVGRMIGGNEVDPLERERFAYLFGAPQVAEMDRI